MPRPLSPPLYKSTTRGPPSLTAHGVSELVSDLLEVFQADPACFRPSNTARGRTWLVRTKQASSHFVYNFSTRYSTAVIPIQVMGATKLYTAVFYHLTAYDIHVLASNRRWSEWWFGDLPPPLHPTCLTKLKPKHFRTDNRLV